MSSAEATPSSTIRMASSPRARPSREVAKPGESRTRIVFLPRDPANAAAFFKQAVDLDPPVPATELSEPGVVEDRAHPDPPPVVRLLHGCGASGERQFRSHAVIMVVDRDPYHMHRFDDIDADRPEVGHVTPIRGSALRCEHTDLFAIANDAERSVGDVPVGIEAHRQCEVPRPVALVPVEVVPVIEVDVGRRRFADRRSRLMNGVVVEATEHSKRP